MSNINETLTLPPNESGLRKAADLLSDGGLVAFPSETVYGLGADARRDTSVAQIFEAKGRPRFNPLIIHLPDLTRAKTYAQFNADAQALAQAFWPGPLTLVVPLRADAGLSPLVTAGLDTVAIRVPEHPVTQGLLRAFDGPLAGPSANPSGRISPTRAAHVLDGLSGKIAAVVDGGACAVGVESTIVGFDETGPVLLRPGGLPTEAIADCLGKPIGAWSKENGISAPGQLTSHYAPRVAVRLNVTTPQQDALWLGFGPDCPGATLNLSPSGDLIEAAANLFHHLRALDEQAKGDQIIEVAPVPHNGLGLAINDRLNRAAAPRP